MPAHIKRLKHQEDIRGPVTIPTDKRAGKDVFKVGNENNCVAFRNIASYNSQRRKRSGRKLCNNIGHAPEANYTSRYHKMIHENTANKTFYIRNR